MATKKNTVTAVPSMAHPSRMPPNARMVQNFHLVWLDGSIDETNNEDCRNSITKLRQVVNTVNTFVDVDECMDFITDIKHEKAFVIVSEALSQIIIPIIQDISQVSSVYIFCGNKVLHEQWANKWSKVMGVFTDIAAISETLKQPVHNCDQNSVSISFVKLTDGALTKNFDQLDSSFMYTQILKEILLTIDFDQVHINEFLTYCREQFAGNSAELRNIDKIEKEYRNHQPIWWYTCGCFLYSMLNRALRTMEVDLIIKMGFFVQDLHNHITALHAEQYGGHHTSDSFTLYRGQGLSETDFDQLKKTQNGLLSFNNFLSTSLDREVSLTFADSNQYNPDLIGVLFEITINLSTSSSPFANIMDVSYFKGEQEILFSMHSVFRIGQVKQIDGNDRLWQVNLTLTSDNDPQLHALTKSMQEEISSGSKGWLRLGKLMIKLGQVNKAEELYEILLKQSTEEGEKAHLYHMLGMVKDNQGNYPEAVEFYEKSIKINQKILPPTHSDLATSYNNIGGVYYNMGDYSKALSYYEKALEIRQKTLPATNHIDLATSYNNIGLVYNKMGEYSKALSYYEKALEIKQKTLPASNPDLATSYNNIGKVYNNMGEYSKALSSHGKALEIYQKTLPANHPHLAASYNNIGLVYYNMGEYSKALSYYEKALGIDQKTLPANHPFLASSYNNIGGVYNKMGEYSKALSYYEKALEIQQKTLPANHMSLVLSHFNVAFILRSLNRNEEAIKHASQALVIASHNVKSGQSEVQKYQQDLNEFLATIVSVDVTKKMKSEHWSYPVLLVLSSVQQSRMHSIFNDLTDGHLMTPISIHEYETKVHVNKEIKNIVVELSSISTDKRDCLLNKFSSVDHIESIYLLGEPPKTSEERSTFFTRFPKVCVFCEDEGQLALRWALDTAEECRTLGDQYIKEGKKDIAREHFQRGMQLFDRLETLIDSRKQK